MAIRKPNYLNGHEKEDEVNNVIINAIIYYHYVYCIYLFINCIINVTGHF